MSKDPQDLAAAGKGCLGWVIRVPAAVGMLVLVASVIDIVQRGPVPRSQATVLIWISVPVIAVFVYLGALVESDLDHGRAIRRLPREFVMDALLLGLVALFAWASNQGSGVGGGGAPSGGGPAIARTNRASDLVDSSVFASALGVQAVRVQADGFSPPQMSRAVAYGSGASASGRPRVSISVYDGGMADARWARAGRSLTAGARTAPGEAAYIVGDRLVFKRGRSVVDMRLHDFKGDVANALSDLGGAVDSRLSAGSSLTSP